MCKYYKKVGNGKERLSHKDQVRTKRDVEISY